MLKNGTMAIGQETAKARTTLGRPMGVVLLKPGEAGEVPHLFTSSH
jgi:hypothetical protein